MKHRVQTLRRPEHVHRQPKARHGDQRLAELLAERDAAKDQVRKPQARIDARRSELRRRANVPLALRDRIFSLLNECGPMKVRRLAAATGESEKVVRAAVKHEWFVVMAGTGAVDVARIREGA